jgi:hypothetical protein
MANLQATIRRYLTPILLLLLAGGYLVILGELFLYQHWDGIQFVGFAATVIGLLSVLLGLFAKRGFRIALALLLAVISLSGLIGTYEHFESRAGEGEAGRGLLTQTTPSTAPTNMMVAYRESTDTARLPAQEGDEEGENSAAGGEREGGEGGEGGEEVPPPLAPLSLAGLSLMGAAVLLAKQDDAKKVN